MDGPCEGGCHHLRSIAVKVHNSSHGDAEQQDISLRDHRHEASLVKHGVQRRQSTWEDEKPQFHPTTLLFYQNGSRTEESSEVVDHLMVPIE